MILGFDTPNHLLILLDEKLDESAMMRVVYSSIEYTHQHIMSNFHLCVAYTVSHQILC